MELEDPLDPKRSRPIDVHRWSDHPEVAGFVDSIWEEHFKDYAAKELVKSGAKAKRKHRDQLRVILLDLYVAWQTDPDLSIGVHLSANAWKTGSRYNALHLSKIIPDFVHRLSEVGLIQLSKGSFTAPGAATNRTARIRAEEPLREMFREAKFGREHIWLVPDRECIILKNTDDLTGVKGREVPYEDDDLPSNFWLAIYLAIGIGRCWVQRHSRNNGCPVFCTLSNVDSVDRPLWAEGS
jgi:hypothetical protein